jgi:FAD/FMN-containing dehydrogenase/Fe-S oxidoreductase
MKNALNSLSASLEGDLYADDLMRALYATDGSIYKEWPLAVARPKTVEDLQKLIAFARQHGVSLIPRTAGTSLAGQCVGTGIVVDVSKYFNQILEVNAAEGWVRVQPGVIRDELNHHLKSFGVFFGPITATATRAMIGGMVGNNSCGTTSIVYGSTRDHVLELHCVLSDGSTAAFGSTDAPAFQEKMEGVALENQLYRQIYEELSPAEVQKEIVEAYPKASIHRRNTGYAIDLLLRQQPFNPEGQPFNFAKMLCGSEGTLAFTTEIKIHVNPLPAPAEVVVCPHFSSLQECMKAVLVAMSHHPTACELMDKTILDCTKDNLEQQKNRFFLEGDPEAVLMIEFRGQTLHEAESQADAMIADMQAQDMGFHYPKVYAPLTKNVFALRAAGFGVLSNLKGDAKAIEFVEDTAVELADLPAYIDEFAELMKTFNQKVVYYAHAGAGELHLRPTLNLKTMSGVKELRAIAEASAGLVKKYRGSLSGEHGDGRVRGEFIPFMIGEKNYELLRRIKKTWDPHNIFNPGKITDAPPMDTALRHVQDEPDHDIPTIFDYSETGGILPAIEKCNGSGDCRKLAFSGGTMCPSYMATRNEKDTTRARANALREFMTMNTQENPFNHPEIYEAMDLCLSCKGCTSECPSNVDMATLKAEFLYHYHKANGTPLRDRVFANIGQLNKLAALVPSLSNAVMGNSFFSSLIKKTLSIAPNRSLPPVATSLRRWYRRHRASLHVKGTPKGKVYFFCDEFTNYNDPHIGQKAIQLLSRLGYQVEMPQHPDSGRAHFSKGLLNEARTLARQNVAIFLPLISAETPILGVEPSAILGFRDEYPKLVEPNQREAARELGRHALLIESFLVQEAQAGRISSADFSNARQHVLVHAHCHQKAFAGAEVTAQALSLPQNFTVELIPSGCCGMAGSFGYEKEHYEVSMQVGELVLFPAVRQASKDAIIAAPGTSCRHQILDGTQKHAQHPVEILHQFLAKK